MNEIAYRNAETALWQHYGLEPSDRSVRLGRYGTRMRVQEIGDGEPVLFIHGGPTSGAGAAALLPYLDGFRCLVIDRPGSGLSEDADWTTALLGDFMSFFVADALDAIGVDRAHVVGSSWGGTVALRATAATPERIDRLVLHGGPSVIEGQSVPGIERLLLTPGVASLLKRLTPTRGMQRSAIKANGHAAAVSDGRIPDAYWDWYAELMRQTPTYRNEIGALGILSSWSRTYPSEVEVRLADLARIDAPTLIVWGGDEPYGGREAADHLANAMPHASVDFMPEAGHLPWLDDPEYVGRATAAFLAGAAEQARAA